MKLKTLRIRNFQSIKDMTIQFEKSGVFHLVGANNIGKSSIVKAIEALLKNVSNNQYKEYLRDDCSTFVLEGDMWSGDKIKLSRGATDYYEWTIDGVEGRMDRTGGKIPEVVENYVNLYQDKEKTKECLNIRLPRSVLLFVDNTAGDNYYLMQKALRTDEFLASMKLSEKKRRETAKEITTVEEYKGREEVKLKKLDVELVNEKTKLEKVENFESVLKDEYEVYKSIEDIANTARIMQKTSNELKEKKLNLKEDDILELKKELQELKEIEEELKIMDDMVEINKKMKRLENKVTEDQIKEFKKGIEEFGLVDEVLDNARKLQRMKKQVAESKEVYEDTDEELAEYMRENKFCPIVAKTIDKACPFGGVKIG